MLEDVEGVRAVCSGSVEDPWLHLGAEEEESMNEASSRLRGENVSHVGCQLEKLSFPCSFFEVVGEKPYHVPKCAATQFDDGRLLKVAPSLV